MVIDLPKRINDTVNGIDSLVFVLDKIHNAKNGDIVILDFSELEWIDANMLSAFGAVLDDNFKRIKFQFVAGSVSPKIENLLARNKFGLYFNFDKAIDKNDTVIEYRVTNGKEIKEFASYFKDRVLQRQKMPKMSKGLKDKILENVLEIFGNAPMHGGCSKVFSCGQIFPVKNSIKFTIANTGQTIKENVIGYYKSMLKREPPKNTISWATDENNSTKQIVNGKSGGLGLYYLKEFININNGSLTICSSDEVWTFKNGEERTEFIDTMFRGTIVTISINTNDDEIYMLSNESANEFSEF